MGDESIGKWDDVPSYWYSTHITYLKATQILHPFKVETPNGIVEGNNGDYLVEVTKGRRYIMSRAEFEKIYEVVNPVRRI